MPYDHRIADVLRADLADAPNLTEKAMFGGLGMMVNGHMICAIHGKGGVMFRVGKVFEPKALALDGVVQMEMRGRPMGGWVDTTDDVIANQTHRAQLVALALDFVTALPPK